MFDWPRGGRIFETTVDFVNLAVIITATDRLHSTEPDVHERVLRHALNHSAAWEITFMNCTDISCFQQFLSVGFGCVCTEGTTTINLENVRMHHHVNILSPFTANATTFSSTRSIYARHTDSVRQAHISTKSILFDEDCDMTAWRLKHHQTAKLTSDANVHSFKLQSSVIYLKRKGYRVQWEDTYMDAPSLDPILNRMPIILLLCTHERGRKSILTTDLLKRLKYYL